MIDATLNNIVALRGALIYAAPLQDAGSRQEDLQLHTLKQIRLKIPNVTPEIIEFCKEFAKDYGYVFEHEATYEKMCLVNNAVYISKYAWAEKKID